MGKISLDHIKSISFPEPEKNILFDDVLLALAEQGVLGNTLRFWESPVYFAVLGRLGKAGEDLKIPEIRRDSLPVLRRSSGGGTVLQGPGCLNFSFILSKEKDKDFADLRKSYLIILEEVLTVLKDFHIEAEFKPVSDLALKNGEKKFSGNAQRRGRNFILHHGTILYDFNLNLIPEYLKMPADIPDYRKNRPHIDFVTNVNVDKNQLVYKFLNRYHKHPDLLIVRPGPQEENLLFKLSKEKSPLLQFS